MRNETGEVGIFFYVNGEFLFHGCPLAKAEAYGDFLNYPKSHDEIWRQHYQKKYHVDFDCFPRGRVIYRKTDGVFLLYYDRCIAPHLEELTARYAGKKIVLDLDEHYQCRSCNEKYCY